MNIHDTNQYIVLNKKLDLTPVQGNVYLCVCNDIVSQWLQELTYLGDNAWSSVAHDVDGQFPCIVEHAIYLILDKVGAYHIENIHS